MSRQTFGIPTIAGDNVEDLRRSTTLAVQLLMDRMDQMAGVRGTPTFYNDVEANGRRITNLGLPQRATDVQRFDCCLHRDHPDAAYDAGGQTILNVQTATEGSQAVNLSQLRAEIASGANTVTNEPFVTATASAGLMAERVLTPQANVTTVTDNGAGSTIVVGVANNGIGNAQLRQGSANSVVGRSEDTPGNVADILASVDGQILRLTGGVLGFGSVLGSGTFTVTGTGFDGTDPTGTARYLLFETMVMLFLPDLSGTSDNVMFTLTGMPAAITPMQTSHHVALITDNTINAYGFVRLNAASVTIDVYRNPDGDNWTIGGTKRLYATWLSYALL